MIDQVPLVSAIMLSGRHYIQDIRLAIECFDNQTYPNKELIIVNNASNQFAASELNIAATENIGIYDTPTEVHSGLARNYGIRAAKGQILAQFDADFWHHPERLQTQIAMMAENQSQVCMLANTLKYSFFSGNAGIHQNGKNVSLATMVFVRPKDVDYPDWDKNEEYGILDRMIRCGYSPMAIDNPELCCKLFLCEPRILKPHFNTMSDSQKKTIRSILKRYK